MGAYRPSSSSRLGDLVQRRLLYVRTPVLTAPSATAAFKAVEGSALNRSITVIFTAVQDAGPFLLFKRYEGYSGYI